MKKTNQIAFSSLGILALALTAFVYWNLPFTEPPPLSLGVLDDVSTLHPTKIGKLVEVRSTDDVRNALLEAASTGQKISIAGKRHSMGGQTLVKDGIVLDMTAFNKVISFGEKEHVLEVESGATWADVQEYLNSRGFAVLAMQGPNIFTIGGSISVNAHGWDLVSEQVGETVRWFNLMLADGTIKRCSNEENEELFQLVIGGYGLFGVILEVGLAVTPNAMMKPDNRLMSYKAFPTFFEQDIKQKPDVKLAYADLSISKDSFLKEMFATRFLEESGTKGVTIPLEEEKYVLRDRFFINLSRRYGWGKNIRWWMEKELTPDEPISRNNLMRAPYKRLLYYSADDVDILQEYFIPREKFVEFADRLRNLVLEHRANLLNCTIRVVNKNLVPYLSYASKDDFAFVLYFNVKKDNAGRESDEKLTNALITEALKDGGTFYLPYLLYYGKEELRAAYPTIDKFFELKRKYDPRELFSSAFYQKYGEH